MRIVVPYTNLHPATVASLTAYQAEFRDVSCKTDSYYELLVEVWSRGESALIVEHDIEATDRAIRQARHCACEWSVSPYRGPGNGMLEKSLGFTRFRGGLMRSHPDVMAEVGTMADSPQIGPRHWARLDCWMLAALMRRGLKPHIHDEVKHHHVYETGCACGEEHG